MCGLAPATRMVHIINKTPRTRGTAGEARLPSVQLEHGAALGTKHGPGPLRVGGPDDVETRKPQLPVTGPSLH
jgi:hypothetical protein